MGMGMGITLQHPMDIGSNFENEYG